MPKTYIEKIDNKGIINFNGEVNNTSFGHALYYPYIHLTNKNWLKHAFLFWDKISRIVPTSFEPQDDEDIIRIRQETNFINDYHPNQDIVNGTFRSFIRDLDSDFLDKYAEKRCVDIRSFSSTNYGKYEKLFQDTDYTVLKNSGYIHIAKMNPYLVNKLIKLGLAIQGEHEYSSWIKIDNFIGEIYMTHLAKIISTENSIPIVTDRVENIKSIEVHEFRYKERFQEQLGYLLIDSVVPKNINNVTMEQLIGIRTKYDDQRMAFFDEVNKLSRALPSIDNKSVLKDALHYHNKLLIKQTKELKKVFNLNGIESVVKPVAISMGVAMATDYMIPSENRLWGASAGLLYGAVTAYTDIRRRQIDSAKDPMSYLLNIQSELDKKSLFMKIKGLSLG